MKTKYPLRDLLRVRAFREDRAARELAMSRNQLAERERELMDRKRQREEYIQWRIKRESELYDEVFKQEVKLKTLDDLKQEVFLLREKEFVFDEKIRDAETALEEANQQLDRAREQSREAIRNREKIEEDQAHWTKDYERLQEEFREKELEDFRVRPADAVPGETQ